MGPETLSYARPQASLRFERFIANAARILAIASCPVFAWPATAIWMAVAQSAPEVAIIVAILIIVGLPAVAFVCCVIAICVCTQKKDDRLHTVAVGAAMIWVATLVINGLVLVALVVPIRSH